MRLRKLPFTNRPNFARLCSHLPRLSKERISWDFLPIDIIDEIAIHVKQTRRWRRDGPSLRLLNKHWSKQMNTHIVKIRPDKSRHLIDADTVSLLKFQFLCCLDISPFLRPFHASRGRHLFDVLSRCPHLSHIDIRRDLLRLCSGQGTDHASLKVHETWEKLTQVSSLRFYCSSDDDDAGDASSYQENWSSSDDRWTMLYASAMIDALPHLKALEFTAWVHCIPCLLSKLQKLERLKLLTLGPSDFLDDLVHWLPPQASLAVGFPYPRELQVLAKLPQLQSLVIGAVTNIEDLVVQGFSTLLQNLLTLQLRANEVGTRIPVGFVTQPLKLNYLSLHKFSFNGNDLLINLPELKTLKLSLCQIRGGVNFFSHLKQLYDLYLCWVEIERDPGYILSDLEPADLITLSSLRYLRIDGISRDDMLTDLVKLSTLEDLSIVTNEEVSLQGLSALQNLPNLRRLGLAHEGILGVVRSFLSQTYLTQLERLDMIAFEAADQIEPYIKRLKKKAPHMIISID